MVGGNEKDWLFQATAYLSDGFDNRWLETTNLYCCALSGLHAPLRKRFGTRVFPSFAKEGNTPFVNYHPENDTRQTVETRALTSRQRSSACVKCNLDSSVFAKDRTFSTRTLSIHPLQFTGRQPSARNACVG